MGVYPLLSKDVYEFALQYRDDKNSKIICRDQDLNISYPLAFGSLQIKENRFLTAYIQKPEDPLYRPTAEKLCEDLEKVFSLNDGAKEYPFVVHFQNSIEDQPAYPVVRLEKEYQSVTLKYYNVTVEHYKIFKD